MTRIAIVAPLEELRVALASALRSNPAFEVVSVVASESEVKNSADIVLVARDPDDAGVATRPVRHDVVSGRHLDEYGEDAPRAALRKARRVVASRSRRDWSAARAAIAVTRAGFDRKSRAEGEATSAKHRRPGRPAWEVCARRAHVLCESD